MEVQVGRFEAVANVEGSTIVGDVERRVDQHGQVRHTLADGQLRGGLEAREVDAATVPLVGQCRREEPIADD